MAAAAMPLGNGSFSTLIIWRFAGTASTTPRPDTTITQATRYQWFEGTAAGFNISSAGRALTTPAPVIEPAAEAVDCMALFSRMLNSGKNLGKRRCTALGIARYSVWHITNARIDEVIAAPIDHPAFSPM